MTRYVFTTAALCAGLLLTGCGGPPMSKTDYARVYSEAYAKGHEEGFSKGMQAGGYAGGYVDPYYPVPYGVQSKLATAVQKGKLDEVKRLIEEEDMSANEIDGQGYSPLQYAARFGFEKVAVYLIDKGADVNHHSGDDYTPLKEAVMSNKPRLVDVLIEAGADIDTVDNGGSSLLAYAIQNGNRQTVKMLLSKGADVNLRNNMGWTPLISAASYGFADLVDLLLSNDANPEDTDSVSGRTALFYAVTTQNVRMVKIVVKAGADVNAVDVSGNTPLIEAVLLGRRDIAGVLIEGGANLEVEAHGPGYGGYVDPMAGLYGGLGYHPAPISPTTDLLEGKKPIHIAAERGYRDLVQLLLKGGAQADAEGPGGSTALSLAKRNGHRGVVELLSKPGKSKKKK